MTETPRIRVAGAAEPAHTSGVPARWMPRVLAAAWLVSGLLAGLRLQAYHGHLTHVQPALGTAHDPRHAVKKRTDLGVA